LAWLLLAGPTWRGRWAAWRCRLAQAFLPPASGRIAGRARCWLPLLRPGRGPGRRDRPLAISDALRLTLDRVVLREVAPERTPQKVRVSLHGDQDWHVRPAPGQVVILTANLAAPEGPVEPGGFDFRRMAFFDRLGAVGYTRTPGAAAGGAAGAGRAGDDRLRQLAVRRHARHIPGEAGAFAAGAMTGDRSGITEGHGAGAARQLAGASSGDFGDEHGLPDRLRLRLFRGGLALVPWWRCG
jgi:competence protein ComEC